MTNNQQPSAEVLKKKNPSPMQKPCRSNHRWPHVVLSEVEVSSPTGLWVICTSALQNARRCHTGSSFPVYYGTLNTSGVIKSYLNRQKHGWDSPSAGVGQSCLPGGFLFLFLQRLLSF